jgi:hypothetical protein
MGKRVMHLSHAYIPILLSIKDGVSDARLLVELPLLEPIKTETVFEAVLILLPQIGHSGTLCTLARLYKGEELSVFEENSKLHEER